MSDSDRTMRIGEATIGHRFVPYVIAEIGVNHDGSLDRALALVESAAHAGADAIKLQFFQTDLLLSGAAKLAAYQRASGEVDPITMLRRLELDLDAMDCLITRAHALNLHAIVTVFSTQLVAPASELPWDAFKVASPDIVHRPLIDALAALGRPLIVSTGAADADEVARAAGWLDGHRHLAFLQCVSSYPTPSASAALGGIAALRDLVASPIGLSDHTESVHTGALAVLLGADILEKHLTWSHTAQGPDHAASLEAQDMARYIDRAKRARHDGAIADQLGLDLHNPWGDPRVGPMTKTVLPIEREVRAIARQSLTTTRDLPAGVLLVESDLTIKRPGTGIAPWHMDEVVGGVTARAIPADMPILSEDLVGVVASALGSPR